MVSRIPFAFQLLRAVFYPRQGKLPVDSDQSEIQRSEYERIVERVTAEIKAREEASRAARRAEEKYRSIFENAVEGIFQTTPEGQYLSANPKLAQIYGYGSADELMASLEDIERQLYVEPSRRDDFERECEERDTVTNFESQVRRCDGTVIWISENARAVRDEQGRLLHYEGTVEDITERKQNEALRAEKEAAVAASKAKSAFLANMSHEIRTPLNGVLGMLELLGSTRLDARQERYVRIARSSAGTLLGLINDILDFSKIEAGKLELEDVPFDLHVLLEDVAEMFGHRATNKGLELSCRILPGVPAGVRGDPERIRQVLINLVNNAIKFTERGEVIIRAEVLEKATGLAHLQISVRDTGIGITRDRLERLFSPFTQVDASTTRKYGGTGLGLAICRQLIELMGGSVGAESESGEGSTFWCIVPLEMTCNGAPPPLTLPDQLRGMSVLTVDDTETNLEILRDQLGSWGMQVQQASDAKTALAMMQRAAEARRPFPLVILDHQMPEMDGLQMAAIVQADPRLSDTTLLMLTSVDHLVDRSQWSSVGLAGVLAKPIRQSRLYDAIVSVVSTEATHRELPLQSEKPQLATPRMASAGQPFRLLVAEDNDINQLVTCEILRSAGYECEVVNNGLEAVAAVRRGGYDLVLMDCQMPEVDGFEATQRIRQLEAQNELPQATRSPLPIIALTANAIAGDRELCLNAGMTDYATKPIERIKLLESIARCLDCSTDTQSAAASPISKKQKPPSTAANETADATGAALQFPELLSRCSGDGGFARKVLKKFHARLPDDRHKLVAAMSRGDTEDARKLAHTLKGSASNLAALPLGAAASELECALRAGELESSREKLPRLELEIERCLTSIGALLAEDGMHV